MLTDLSKLLKGNFWKTVALFYTEEQAYLPVNQQPSCDKNPEILSSELGRCFLSKMTGQKENLKNISENIFQKYSARDERD